MANKWLFGLFRPHQLVTPTKFGLNDAMVDKIIRAMTNDGALRLVALRSTDTVLGAVNAQSVSGKTAQFVGEMVTGAALYRETMAPTLRVQCIMRSPEGGRQILADSHPEGWCRALVQNRDGGEFTIGEGTLLQMMRTMPNGELHRGTVDFTPEANISDALASYMARSEQVESYVAVSCVTTKEGNVATAGGFLVQLLPEAPEHTEVISIVMNRLEKDFANLSDRLLRTDADPEKLIAEIFTGIDYTTLEESEIRFGCNCSHERVLAGISTIAKSDIQEMVDAGQVLEVGCDYCGADYRVKPEDLRGMLASS